MTLEETVAAYQQAESAVTTAKSNLTAIESVRDVAKGAVLTYVPPTTTGNTTSGSTGDAPPPSTNGSTGGPVTPPPTE